MRISLRSRAILQALFVTFLWSSSWVLIKIALHDIPPPTFAGLRYTIAFFVLLPALWNHRVVVRTLSVNEWGKLAALGFIFYTLQECKLMKNQTDQEQARYRDYDCCHFDSGRADGRYE